MKIHHNIVLNKHRSRLALAIVILTLTVENVKKKLMLGILFYF